MDYRHDQGQHQAVQQYELGREQTSLPAAEIICPPRSGRPPARSLGTPARSPSR